MAIRTAAIIPVRWESTRFPGKVGHLYRGKPLLYYVWREIMKARTPDRVVIATDSEKVLSLAESFGAETVKTSSRPKTGSDRVAEIISKVPASVYVNVQADAFGRLAPTLDRVVSWMHAHRKEEFATIARPFEHSRDIENPNCVKVVSSPDGYALWFSRSPLPLVRGGPRSRGSRAFQFRHHIGVYFFRRAGLKAFGKWKQTPLEQAESLEQLRILEHHRRIRLFDTRARLVTVDTKVDVKALKGIIK